MLLDVGFAVPYAGCALELGPCFSLVVVLLVGSDPRNFSPSIRHLLRVGSNTGGWMKGHSNLLRSQCTWFRHLRGEPAKPENPLLLVGGCSGSSPL